MMDAVYRVMDLLLPIPALRFGFMKNALLALLILTPLLALVGTMAVNKRMAFFSDALGHSALAGVGLALVMGVSNVPLAMITFGILWALAISRINQGSSTSADTNISVFSSTGVALGLALLSGQGKFSSYSSLLVGDILAVTPQDLGLLALMFLPALGLWLMLYNSLVITAINPALARSRGIRVRLVEYAFVCLVSVLVMLSIRWIGVMLINALIILPAAAARNIAANSRQHALFSVLISLFSGICGLFLSLPLGTGAGAAIVLVAAAMYGLTLLVRFVLKRD